MTEPIAIDPPGCGCTECLVGDYVPLDLATPAQVLAAQCGVIADHTSGALPALAVTRRPTQFEVSCLPERDLNAHVFAIHIEYRGQRDGRELWCVTRFGQCLDANGDWDHEPIPSSRTDEWIASHRFDFETATRLAAAAAPRVIVNGRTVADVLRVARGVDPT